jgi:hypothetical protein
MRAKERRWTRDQEDDPVSGLINLFDVWIVVVVALILALVNANSNASKPSAADDDTQRSVPSENIEEIASKLPKFRKSDSSLTGQGELLGTAYRLQNGEIVYVPQAK